MSCNTRYWMKQSCSAPQRPRNQALADETAARLAAIQQERAAQDARWSYAAPDQASTDHSTARRASAKSK